MFLLFQEMNTLEVILLFLQRNPSCVYEFAFSIGRKCWSVSRLLAVDIASLLLICRNMPSLIRLLLHVPILPVGHGFLASPFDFTDRLQAVQAELCGWPQERSLCLSLHVLVSEEKRFVISMRHVRLFCSFVGCSTVSYGNAGAWLVFCLR